MDDDEIKNQGVSTINRKLKRLIYASAVDNSRSKIGNRRKYIRDANGTLKSKSVIVSSVPPNTSCSYSTVNFCKFKNTTLTLVKRSQKVCKNKLHHTCQSGYASASVLKDLYNVPEKVLCPKHVGDFYNLGVLAREYDMFNNISENSLMHKEKLYMHNKAGGQKCLPICQHFLNLGILLINHGRNNTLVST